MTPDLISRFSALLILHRNAKGWTQDELADQAKISIHTVQHIEQKKARPSFKTIEKLAFALQIDWAELFTADLPASAVRNAKNTAVALKVYDLDETDLTLLNQYIDTLRSRPSRK